MTIELADGSFPVNRYQCSNCGGYGLSYTLCFRLRLNGWSGPAMDDVRDRLGLADAEVGRTNGQCKPLVIMRAESREVTHLDGSENWKIFAIE